MEELNDKTVCADTDLRADMERWHKNKQKDLKELFMSQADRQIKYYEKVKAFFLFSLSNLKVMNWYRHL